VIPQRVRVIYRILATCPRKDSKDEWVEELRHDYIVDNDGTCDDHQPGDDSDNLTLLAYTSNTINTQLEHFTAAKTSQRIDNLP